MRNEERNLENIKAALEDDEVVKLLNQIEKRVSLVIKDTELHKEEYVSVSDLIDEGIHSMCRKPMFISRARIGKNSDAGYAVEYMNHDGDIVTDAAYKFLDGDKVSIGLIEKLREMAYQGYELNQGKEDKVVDVFR